MTTPGRAARRAGVHSSSRKNPHLGGQEHAPRRASTDTSAGGPRVGGLEPTYSPRADGRPDPGEVVWAWVPYEEDASRGKDRPVLVLAVRAAVVLALPLSSIDHDRDAAQEAEEGRYWMDVGS